MCRALVLVLSFLVLGCGPAGGGAQVVPLPAPGAQHTFVVQVYNGAQLPIFVTVAATLSGNTTTYPTQPGTAELIPLGAVAYIDLGAVPETFTVNATVDYHATGTGANRQVFSYQPQTYSFGRDYTTTDTFFNVSFYQQGSPGSPPPRVAPQAPASLSANPVTSSQVGLTWSSSQGATSYAVLRGTVSGGPYVQVGTTNTGTTSFTDTGLKTRTTYFYVVQASSNGGTSPDSNEANATTP
ncbi:MAG TPA: fibronectin type III domain-containing protein [Planctomycetota bacterium]|nr:fibronectin type III domain-containing protein [Planctomycetota bacterium]